MHDQLYTTAEIAARAHVHRMTVVRAILAGRLKAHKIGRLWRISEDQYRAWMGLPAEIPAPAPDSA